jgi:hypothetical protein
VGEEEEAGDHAFETHLCQFLGGQSLRPKEGDVLSPLVESVFRGSDGFGHGGSHFPNRSLVKFGFHLAKYFHMKLSKVALTVARVSSGPFRIDEGCGGRPGFGITGSFLESRDVSIGLSDFVLQGREIGFRSADCLVGTR